MVSVPGIPRSLRLKPDCTKEGMMTGSSGDGQGCDSAARSEDGACSWWNTGAVQASLCCLGSAFALSSSEGFFGLFWTCLPGAFSPVTTHEMQLCARARRGLKAAVGNALWRWLLLRLLSAGAGSGAVLLPGTDVRSTTRAQSSPAWLHWWWVTGAEPRGRCPGEGRGCGGVCGC